MTRQPEAEPRHQPKDTGACEHEWWYCSEYDAALNKACHFVKCILCKQKEHGKFDGDVHGYEFNDIRFPHNSYREMYFAPGWIRKDSTP